MAIRRGILTALRAEQIPPSETWLELSAVYAMLRETLARAFLAGPLEAGAAAERATALLGQRPGWLAGLAERFVARFGVGGRPRFRAAVAFLRADDFLGEAAPPRTVRWLTPPMMMRPAGAYGVPALVSVGELADWLCLGVTELEWLADLRGLARPGHYHYQVVAKQSGAERMLEAPKARLKAAQGRILREILDLVPGHEAAHGFRAGRSVHSFVRPHVGRAVVARLDLRDFFRRSGGRGCRRCFAGWGIRSWWRICWVDCVRMWQGREGRCTGNRICHRGRRRRRHWRTCVFTGLIAGWRGWLGRRGWRTRGMRMIWRFPGILWGRRCWRGWGRLCWKRGTVCSTGRRG